MQAFHLLVAFLCITSSTLAAARKSADDDKHLRHRKTKKFNLEENQIVGGSFVQSSSEYPWFAAGNGCGGSLIAPDVLLTAAHCVSAFKVGGTVRLKSISKKSGGQVKKIKQLKKHPNYNGYTNAWDFMLVKIEKTTGITPVQLNSYAAVPSGGQSVTVLGFGATNAAGTIYPNKLKHVTVKALTHTQCKKQYGSQITSEDAMMCAGAVGKDSCFGDSGGPLITTTNPPTLVGVVSWGPSRCANRNKFGVYARVSGSYEWVRSTMCALTDTSICGGGTPSPPAPAPAPGPAPSPAPAPAPSSGPVIFDMFVQYDKYADETGVYIEDYTDTIYSVDPLSFTISNGIKKYPSIPIQQGGTYWLYMTDEYGDGFCCDHGKNGYVLLRAVRDGTVIWRKKVGGYMANGYYKLVQFSVPTF